MNKDIIYALCRIDSPESDVIYYNFFYLKQSVLSFCEKNNIKIHNIKPYSNDPDVKYPVFYIKEIKLLYDKESDLYYLPVYCVKIIEPTEEDLLLHIKNDITKKVESVLLELSGDIDIKDLNIYKHKSISDIKSNRELYEYLLQKADELLLNELPVEKIRNIKKKNKENI